MLVTKNWRPGKHVGNPQHPRILTNPTISDYSVNQINSIEG
ncbi:hypothetical protein [Methanobrevibacter arboriphilus]|nr:hypothetical protein [Methanobrevibacter arboriphilus]